jgi:hypothetical protein
MRLPGPVAAAALALLVAAAASSQQFKVSTEHPRLFLRPQRLRLLKREVQRESLRWQQLAMLMEGKARMPEPGFALALYYQASGNEQAGLEAVKWALAGASDLRQLALVFDWCQPLMSPEQSRMLAGRLEQGLKQAPAARDVASMRARGLAAVALADHLPGVPELTFESIVRQWWQGEVVPALKSGRAVISRDDHYALFELLHALRDNLDVDLAEAVPALLRQLPLGHLFSYYPASYPGGENEYRIPAPAGQPVDLRRAALSRAAELAIVAYEPNAFENQSLQGWLMHDRFLLRSAFGITYEFLWANPYQPGGSYYHLPLAFYDELFGRLFLRSSWDDEARWLGYFDGRLEVFENSEPKAVPLRAAFRPVQIGSTVVTYGASSLRLEAASEVTGVYVLGLRPLGRYEIRADSGKAREERADRHGVLHLEFPGGLGGLLRLREIAARQ